MNSCRTQIQSATRLLIVGLFALYSCLESGSAAQSSRGGSVSELGKGRRPVTVADAIQMVQIGDRSYLNNRFAKGNVVQFSPDGRLFCFVTQKGNLENNTVEFSLFVFRTTDAFHSPVPEKIVTLASSSNREAISHPTWLADNNTIVFLGERPGQMPHVYKIDSTTRKLQNLTNDQTEIRSFAITSNGEHLFYVAKVRGSDIINESMRLHGYTVKDENPWELLTREGARSEYDTRREIFEEKLVSGRPTKLGGTFKMRLLDEGIHLSPSGKFALVRVAVEDVPEVWTRYQDSYLQTLIRETRRHGIASRVYQDMLIDAQRNSIEPLINAPLSHSELYSWSPTSESIVLANAYLPLDIDDLSERNNRQSNVATAEINVSSRKISNITQQEGVASVRWDGKTNEIILQVNQLGELHSQKYRTIAGAWKEVEEPGLEPELRTEVSVALEQDLNTPPRLVAVNNRTRERAILMDLNPQFEELSFGPVEAVNWKATDGHEVRGALYRPPDYVAGRRYPLVIQTHGFTPNRFWIDGPWSTAFTAQPLANKGIVVLQVGLGNDEDDKVLTIDEAPRQMAAYEGAIDYLDRIGLVERDRVGLIGFSRTGAHVLYTLTHSKYGFSAATVADASDFSYLQYILYSKWPGMVSDYAAVNGGPPFGDSLKFWMKNAPDFNMEKIRTPLRIEATSGAFSVLGHWEFYAGLQLLGRPVELIYFPDGFHMLVKPWERMTSQQGNVDWFCFWLKREQDSDPSKARQYARWQELRNLQNQSQTVSAIH